MIPTTYLAIVNVKSENGTKTAVIKVCSAASIALIAVNLFENNCGEGVFKWGKVKEIKVDDRQIMPSQPTIPFPNTRDGIIGDTILSKVNGKWAVVQEFEDIS